LLPKGRADLAAGAKHTPKHGVSEVSVNRGLDLVWRGPMAIAPAAFDGAAPQHSVTALAALSTSMDPAPAAATAQDAPRRERDALRALALDPAVADRLADDVIRRVERRIRIERERRGI
jgi:hypothetical protein